MAEPVCNPDSWFPNLSLSSPGCAARAVQWHNNSLFNHRYAHANVLTEPGPLCHLNEDQERERPGLLEPRALQGFTNHLSDHLYVPGRAAGEGLKALHTVLCLYSLGIQQIMGVRGIVSILSMCHLPPSCFLDGFQ